MDKQRYTIIEQIGQGGMGAVFRAFDTRMNREVAIKRIRREGQVADESDAAERIVKEAGALAALQHPHIVTVYDVGSDQDGPYVVMELINGKTVDELIERAPLTWPDFRELAMQTQEALIGAQDRNLIHRDLKPSNLMLTWLPSGKFQVKIVDFGLAKLAEAATLGNLEQADSVFGSVFFMCPEQFERAELDARADLYSIGCVYYHALTQAYPFNGETGMQVMTAHLNHEVIPLHQVRPDLPRWACDWVMWHINRLPADRPQNARNSLKVFLQNDNSPQPQPQPQPMSTGPTQPAPEQPKRPRLIIPGVPPPAAPEPPQPERPDPPRTQTAPQPLLPPEGSLPSVHSSPFPEPAPAPPPPPPPVAAAPPPPPPAAAPPPPVAMPTPTAPAGPPSRLAIGGRPTSGPVPAAVPVPGPRPGALGGAPPVGYQPQTPQAAAPTAYKKQALSNGAKVAIAAVLGLLVVILAFAVIGKSGSNKRTQTYNKLVEIAAKDDAKEVPVNKEELDVLLNAAVDVGANMQRQTVYKALWLAKAKDGTDVDAVMAEFATKQMMADDIREVLIRDVLRKRKNPAVVPALMDFCRSTSDTRAAIAAIQACRFMSGEKEFPKYVEIVEYNTVASIRQAAEENIGEILKKSPNREALGQRVVSAQANAVNDEVKYALTRLLGYVGGAKAGEVVKKSLESTDKKEQLAAAVAFGSWADDTMFETFVEYMDKVTDEQLRARVFDAGYRFLTIPDRKRDSDTGESFWKMLARSAKTREEQMKIIRGLANNETDDWADAVIEYFVNESKDDAVIDLAEKARERLAERARAKNGSTEDKDAKKEEDSKKEEDTKKEETKDSEKDK